MQVGACEQIRFGHLDVLKWYVIRLILNAGLEASMGIPSVLTLMDTYHDKSNIIHMLVEEYGLIGEVERDSKYCLMVQEHLQEMGYQVNCS